MKTLIAGLAIALTFAAGSAHSQEPAPNGKSLYKEKCVMCHDKTGMGTGILSRRVKIAELLLRTDLNAEYIVVAARSGIGNMPPIPRGEASDQQLRAIADYLTQPLEARK